MSLDGSPPSSNSASDPTSDTHSPEHAHDEKFHWTPKRSIAECEKILTAPGRLHELEHAVIDDRVVRVYKNLPVVSQFLRSFVQSVRFFVPSGTRLNCELMYKC